LFTEIPFEIWLAGVLALYMAWAIGANDVANAMGTSVGSGSLSIRNRELVIFSQFDRKIPLRLLVWISSNAGQTRSLAAGERAFRRLDTVEVHGPLKESS